jgi:hypothetical protein
MKKELYLDNFSDGAFGVRPWAVLDGACQPF